MASKPSLGTDVLLNHRVPADAYDRATSNLVHLNDLEQMIQQIIDMGGGSWDRETHSAFPQIQTTPKVGPAPELYCHDRDNWHWHQIGTNTITEMSPAGAAPLSGLPNSSPLNMFPQNHHPWYNALTYFLFRDLLEQAELDMPHSISVTPEEQEAIERVCAIFLL
ncbi:putative ubiquitin receptor RAD23a [Cinnamomum micranthum f. kanehirae]|uniref:Putative ubiquitin receptor RAD23a n=1 Tax=Cinnamomum micranthum f. kanehirae TaxID=337451 RepID=A0A443PT69_9MAGN|nr:putative ubiquitin receptor RAD23a [Cinnamomum micranthum f. kanehirae]